MGTVKKRRNGVRHSSLTRDRARLLRKEGRTHREISRELQISLGSASLWTKGISLSVAQQAAIYKRRKQHVWTSEERIALGIRLDPYRRKYTPDDLLAQIRDFYVLHGRIPLKREFHDSRTFRVHFGTWNNAIQKAGFPRNPVLFSKRCVAQDGHLCDSFTEKIIDDWLLDHHIPHERSVRYGNTKMTVDFSLGPSLFLEFFGLAGVQKKYDKLLRAKQLFCEAHAIRLLAIYPRDIFPENHLSDILRELY